MSVKLSHALSRINEPSPIIGNDPRLRPLRLEDQFCPASPFFARNWPLLSNADNLLMFPRLAAHRDSG